MFPSVPLCHMATAETDGEDKWVTARVDPDLKRFIGMRAEELGMNKSEYMLELIRDDLESVEYADV